MSSKEWRQEIGRARLDLRQVITYLEGAQAHIAEAAQIEHETDLSSEFDIVSALVVQVQELSKGFGERLLE